MYLWSLYCDEIDSYLFGKISQKSIQSCNRPKRALTRSRFNSVDTFTNYCNHLKGNEALLSNDISHIVASMTCPSVADCGLFKWTCVMNRCNSCPDFQIPSQELISDSTFDNINYCTYKFQSKCKLYGILTSNATFSQKCKDLIGQSDMNVPEKIIKRKEITSIDTNHWQFSQKYIFAYAKTIQISYGSCYHSVKKSLQEITIWIISI